MRFFSRIAPLFLLFVLTLPAAEISGIWTGLAPNRHSKQEDVAFQFHMNGAVLTGKLFGDEFDLPIEEASLVGNKLSFSVTTTNYYSGVKIRFVYSGTISGNSLELTRERTIKPGETPPKEEGLKQTFVLKRLIR